MVSEWTNEQRDPNEFGGLPLTKGAGAVRVSFRLPLPCLEPFNSLGILHYLCTILVVPQSRNIYPTSLVVYAPGVPDRFVTAFLAWKTTFPRRCRWGIVSESLKNTLVGGATEIFWRHLRRDINPYRFWIRVLAQRSKTWHKSPHRNQYEWPSGVHQIKPTINMAHRKRETVMMHPNTSRGSTSISVREDDSPSCWNTCWGARAPSNNH
jgi:hypothetical protein